jgi:Mrp family chromosome partitioning ATPase
MQDTVKRDAFAHLDRCFARPGTAEALAGLISNLGLTESMPPTLVGLTASVSKEGSTTLALYLGRQVAETFRIPTLVVEANFRHPSLARCCRWPESPGLRDVLESDSLEVEGRVRPVPGTELSLLPAGGTHANPLSLVASDRFRRFLAESKDRFKVVIVDVPPVIPYSESIPILKAMDRRALVVRAHSTRKDLVIGTLEKLKDQGISLDGTILNRW